MTEIPVKSTQSRSIAKRFLVIFTLASCLLFAAAATHYLVRESANRVERERSEMLNIRLGKAAIARNLQDVISDLTFLARHNETTGIFAPGSYGARRALARQFLVFSKQKGKYDQIRVLNETGDETVRVNYNRGDPVITDETELQDKSDRYYFAETWALSGRNIYVSPFDLNVEHGEIENPQVPMVRFGTLLFDRDGRKRGVLLLNYLGSILIGDFRQAAANIADHVMLLNSDGFWLSSPGNQDEWGFMYGNSNTFENRFPEAWQRISTADTGQFYNRDGLFSFTTIYLVSDSLVGGRDPAEGSASVDRSYYWKAVSQMAPQRFSAGLADFMRRNLPLYVVMFFLLAVASFVVAQTRFHHRQAISAVESERRFRDVLERRVEERTRELRITQEEKNLVVQHLIQAEKMAAIGTMASGIGHEINNPLYSILGLAEAIRDDDDPPLAQKHAEKILCRTMDIAGIVRNLTGYARPFVGKELQPVDVNESVREAVSMAERALLDNRIVIRTDLADLPGISGYPEEIRQVFFNVIRNGLQSMNGPGTLEITSRRNSESVIVRVTDTGDGITPENLNKVFDPFFTTREPDQGEGMGLYVVHQIVQKYGGSISFESVVGTGTTCLIEFPLTQMNPEEGTE